MIRRLAYQILWLAALALVGCQTQPTEVQSANVPLVDGRFLISAQINGQPAKLALDTGSSVPLLYDAAAKRLGLKITAPDPRIKPAPGRVILGWTEPCEIEIFGRYQRGDFNILNSQNGTMHDIDGLVAWPSFRDLVLIFDAQKNSAQVAESPPDGLDAWVKLSLLKDYPILAMQVTTQDGQTGKICVDTGDFTGIHLPPEQWRAWRAAHPNAPVTLAAGYLPGTGLHIGEICWADEITLGPLHFTDVPVEEATVTHTSSGGEGYFGTLGLYALSRMNLVVDGKNALVYAQPVESRAKPFIHNQVGAVFLPADLNGGPNIGHVLANGPAAQAGIRDGDVLLQVNGNDAQLHFGSGAVGDKFTGQRPGTKLDLTLQRDGQEFHAIVTLRDLIGPGVGPSHP
ncbi:MAG TPA: aspartyl protease family protein [Opitutales bacterium]|jgi:hypothetical protein|nr:aspartyl protease family protein [Opitutales bacterium]